MPCKSLHPDPPDWLKSLKNWFTKPELFWLTVTITVKKSDWPYSNSSKLPTSTIIWTIMKSKYFNSLFFLSILDGRTYQISWCFTCHPRRCFTKMVHSPNGHLRFRRPRPLIVIPRMVWILLQFEIILLCCQKWTFHGIPRLQISRWRKPVILL